MKLCTRLQYGKPLILHRWRDQDDSRLILGERSLGVSLLLLICGIIFYCLTIFFIKNVKFCIYLQIDIAVTLSFSKRQKLHSHKNVDLIGAFKIKILRKKFFPKNPIFRLIFQFMKNRSTYFSSVYF